MLISLHEELHEVIYKSHIKSDILDLRRITERPTNSIFLYLQQKVLKKLHEVYTKSAYLFYDYSTHWIE